MRIGVISDTHIQVRRSVRSAFGPAPPADDPLTRLDLLLDRHLVDVDRLIHLGDFTGPEVAHHLASRAPLDAVYGNMDGAEIRALFPEQQVLEIEGFRLGLYHGAGSGEGLRERVRRRFNEPLDAILHGHSHYPSCERVDGVLMLNPGSPTDRRGAPYCAVAVLEIGDALDARIIRLE